MQGPRAVDRRTPAVVVLALIGYAVVTAGAVLLKAHTGSEGQIGLDTAASCIGVLLAYLLFGRFRESRLFGDLLLCWFLLLLGAGNAVFSALPRSFGHPALQSASAVAGITAGGAFAAATWLPRRRWPWSPRAAALALIGAAVLALVICARLGSALPREGYGSSDSFGATPDRALTAAQLLAALLFVAGAWGAARSAAADRLLLWLTGAAVLGAGSRLNFAVSHRVADEWSTAGTILRVAFYVVLIAAAGTEIGSYWRRVAEVAVLEERRRIARDLHDGLAQELAFVVTQSRALAERSEVPTRARLVSAAAERALDESRRAIAALTRPLDEPLEVTVAQCVEEVCGRFGKAAQLDLQPGVEASAETREALLRIVREAVSNAARHSDAGSVRVRLRRDGVLTLQVADDGRGFDPNDLAHLSGRFGLVSMRERAQGLGGTFTLVSRVEGGTSIEVTLP